MSKKRLKTPVLVQNAGHRMDSNWEMSLKVLRLSSCFRLLDRIIWAGESSSVSIWVRI